MVRHQVVGLAGEPDAAVGQHHQVVTDLLQVAQQMRGQNHPHVEIADELHQVLQESTPRQRVERGHRLVADQQFGPFGHGDRQRELRPLTAREPPGLPTGVEPGLPDTPLRQALVPARVELGTQPQMLPDRQVAVHRCVLGHEPHARQLLRAAAGPPAEHHDAALGRLDQPTSEPEQGRLARPVRADQAHHATGRYPQLDVREHGMPTVPFTEAVRLDRKRHVFNASRVGGISAVGMVRGRVRTGPASVLRAGAPRRSPAPAGRTACGTAARTARPPPAASHGCRARAPGPSR